MVFAKVITLSIRWFRQIKSNENAFYALYKTVFLALGRNSATRAFRDTKSQVLGRALNVCTRVRHVLLMAVVKLVANLNLNIYLQHQVHA